MEKIKLGANTKYALEGRVVSLDAESTVFESGVIYIEGDTIVDVRKSSQSPPQGFTKKDIIKTGGTIYPGLIELHNHLSYNILPMWDVPKTFFNRDQWRRHPDYKKKMTGPMRILGKIDGYLQAIVRYVECKLLFSGVTSSQGITLSIAAKIQKLYKGVVRNVEQTIDDDLPGADTRIADVDAKDAAHFQKILEKCKNCYLIHLAEGVNTSANKHFKALQVSPDNWAITDKLAGIHSVGLYPEDFKVMRDHNGSIIWSPMSNFLLYGTTADIKSAKKNELLIGMGSDWSASGSKNLLCELKVAHLFNKNNGNLFTDEQLIRTVTTDAAKILHWDKKIGSLEKGKKADLIVLRGKKGEPCTNLINSNEHQIILVVIDGWPRFGYKRFLGKFDVTLEKVRIGTYTRYMNLKNESENIIDIDVSFKDAQKKLIKGMRDLPQLAKQQEDYDSGIFAGTTFISEHQSDVSIFLEHEDHEGSSQRHHFGAEFSCGGLFDQGATVYSEILEGLELDPPTIADDHRYFDKLARQMNLPDYIAAGLPGYYGRKVTISAADSVSRNKSYLKRSNFDSIQSLATFRMTPGYLHPNDRLTIIDQAISILKNAYVHLPLKRARHASNPLKRLDLLRDAVQYDDDYNSELEFHSEIIQIFNSLRDLHTVYHLPAPFNDKVVFVPFMIEECYEGEEPKYIISRIMSDDVPSSFKIGVEVTHWNNIPIRRAIASNGDRYAGSNKAARFARGLNSMTFRHLEVMLPPEEESVTLNYRDPGSGKRTKGIKRRISFPWLVGSVNSEYMLNMENGWRAAHQTLSGYDYNTLLVQNTRKAFFAPGQLYKRKLSEGSNKRENPFYGFEETRFPNHFRCKKVTHEGKSYGYIRIFSFDTDNPLGLAEEFARLLHRMPPTGVILDVRNNGGGHIRAAEYMLQTLSKKYINTEAAQFINSDFIEYLCRVHSPSNINEQLDLSRWRDSLDELRNTGEDYSQGFPLTPRSLLKRFRSNRGYKLVLITDALCYSATDIFASGFQDNKLGTILGIHENTGAGGANVWTHSILYELTLDVNGDSQYFEPLPCGANFTVAIRRMLRTGDNQGLPLEDLGVEPDYIHRMTKADLLGKDHANRDLIARACEILRE